ncbi:MAG: HPr family phosphocarrier protein [Clostridia bacterium]|nr:HPr family phosphocarrier protein [Clostridia bacterium]
MYTTEVFFKNLSSVKEFVDTIAKYDSLEINLVSDIYNMNAHSLIGIISLDISKPITLEVPSGDIPESFYEDIKPYLYQK